MSGDSGVNKKTWRDHFRVHAAANAFPMMSEAELRELGKDIKANGQIQPVVLWKGQLLDGRNRLAAMELEGVTDWTSVRWVKVDDDTDPHDYAVAANIHRRHLTAKQRQELLISLIAKDPKRSNRSISKVTGVTDKTVAAARTKGVKERKIPHQDKVVGADGKTQKAKKTITKPKSTSKTKPAPVATKSAEVDIEARRAQMARLDMSPEEAAAAASADALSRFAAMFAELWPQMNLADRKRATDLISAAPIAAAA